MLLLNLGNTRLKWRLQGGPAYATPVGDYQALLAALSPGESARLASTAPTAVCDDLLANLAGHLVVPQRVVARDHFRGLQIAYAASASFGVDRWLALLAARERCLGRAVIVLSAGTALTADAVGVDGHHLGGYIAPGPAAVAAALPVVLSPYAAVGAIAPGRSTAECVAAGYSSLYLGALMLWRQRFSAIDADLLLTGGDSHRLAEWCGMLGWAGTEYPELVLEGLALAADAV